jgi:hypothetical protein
MEENNDELDDGYCTEESLESIGKCDLALSQSKKRSVKLQKQIELLAKRAEIEEKKLKLIEAPKKPKKVLSEKQMEINLKNLERGRQTRQENALRKKEEIQKIAEEITKTKINKKVTELTKPQKEPKPKKIITPIEEPEEEVEIEERIIKKPKKKRIIIREVQESDSEEEIVIKNRRKRAPDVKPTTPPEIVKPKPPAILFY